MGSQPDQPVTVEDQHSVAQHKGWTLAQAAAADGTDTCWAGKAAAGSRQLLRGFESSRIVSINLWPLTAVVLMNVCGTSAGKGWHL